jgi:hypothetical protein
MDSKKLIIISSRYSSYFPIYFNKTHFALTQSYQENFFKWYLVYWALERTNTTKGKDEKNETASNESDKLQDIINEKVIERRQEQ